MLNEFGKYISIASHLKIIVNNITIRPSMIINTQLKKTYADTFELLKSFLMTKQHIDREYIDNIISFKFYHPNNMKLFFDFPYYFNYFKNLCLLCNRAQVSLNFDILKIIFDFLKSSGRLKRLFDS